MLGTSALPLPFPACQGGQLSALHRFQTVPPPGERVNWPDELSGTLKLGFSLLDCEGLQGQFVMCHVICRAVFAPQALIKGPFWSGCFWRHKHFMLNAGLVS